MSVLPPAAPVWGPHPRRSVERAGELARALAVPLPVAHALVHRGVDTIELARRYLEPALEDLHDPREMLDLDRATERILAAVAAGERILVHGDYDVDGITASFLLQSVLHELGARTEVRIPHRIHDGYGLSRDAVDFARESGCTLIVTVDCGITAHEAVDYAASAGIDTVVTDHHEPQATLPRARAIVNPLRPGCPYPFKMLAGVGVVFKLAEHLLQGRGGLEQARRYLDVVALGTIADVVPLVGENRILAKFGLDCINERRRPGLVALMQQARLRGQRVTSGQVAFVMAPRINAAARMGHARQGLGLLMARDREEAAGYAESLEEENSKRRREDEKVLREAQALVESELRFPECHSIVLWAAAAKWHPGVIGIVASRLTERFRRPAVLIAIDEKGVGRGSGRSVAGLDLTQLLDGCGDLLVTHGGHAFAAGLTVRQEHLPALRERFEQLVRERHRPEQFVRREEIDADLRLDEIDEDLVQALERLAPHGLGNPEPRFRITGVRARNAVAVGAGKHLRFDAWDGTREVAAIWFGQGEKRGWLAGADRLELLCVPTVNAYDGQSILQLKIRDVRKG